MKAFEIAGVPRDEISRFVKGLHSDPFGVLGPHKIGVGVENRIIQSLRNGSIRKVSFASPSPARGATFRTISAS